MPQLNLETFLKVLERGLVYSPPGYLPTLYAAVLRLHPITYFKVKI